MRTRLEDALVRASEEAQNVKQNASSPTSGTGKPASVTRRS